MNDIKAILKTLVHPHSLSHTFTHTHVSVYHESGDVDLGSVGCHIDLLGGPGLALGVDDHTVSRQPGGGRGPGDTEGGGANLRELQVCGSRDRCRRREHKVGGGGLHPQYVGSEVW